MKALPANDWIYQLAMVCYFLSYISPNLIFLRFVLACGSVFLFAWSVATLGVGVDVCIWNGVFFIINVSQGCYLLWKLRPIKFKNQMFEDLYDNVFAPPLTAMCRAEFLELSNRALVRELQPGTAYATAGDCAHNLSILISGSLDVWNRVKGSSKEIVVNTVKSFEFIDSPQWLVRKQKDHKQNKFIVSLRAGNEECCYIMWPTEALEDLFKTNPQIRSHMESAIGRDVAYKLLSVDSIVQGRQYDIPRTPSQSGIADGYTSIPSSPYTHHEDTGSTQSSHTNSSVPTVSFPFFKSVEIERSAPDTALTASVNSDNIV